MSYKIALSGDTLNTSEVWSLQVGPGWSEPWLDAALIVQNVPADRAARLPVVVRDALVQARATVDRVEWGSGSIAGRLYVRWKPATLRPAVEYANSVKRFFENYAATAMPGAHLILERYRIDRSWPREDLYVYPDTTVDGPATTLAPPVPLPDQFDPTPVIAASVAAGSLLLVGLGVWGYGRRVRRNRRRRR